MEGKNKSFLEYEKNTVFTEKCKQSSDLFDSKHRKIFFIIFRASLGYKRNDIYLFKFQTKSVAALHLWNVQNY